MLNNNTGEFLAYLQGSGILALIGFCIISIGVGMMKKFSERDKGIIISLTGVSTTLIILDAPIFSMTIFSCNIIFIAHLFLKGRKLVPNKTT